MLILIIYHCLLIICPTPAIKWNICQYILIIAIHILWLDGWEKVVWFTLIVLFTKLIEIGKFVLCLLLWLSLQLFIRFLWLWSFKLTVKVQITIIIHLRLLIKWIYWWRLIIKILWSFLRHKRIFCWRLFLTIFLQGTYRWLLSSL